MTRLYFRIAIGLGLVLPLACLWMFERGHVVASAAVPASASLFIELGGGPDPVQAGSDITYSMGIGNNGPDDAINAMLSAAVPAHTTFVSITGPESWTCTTPMVGATGTILCSKSLMAAGESVEFTIVVNVNPGTQDGTVIPFTVNINSDTPDPDTSNNSGTVSVVVEGSPCTITCPANITAPTNATQCGANVDYPVPSSTSDCGPVTCTPAPGSFFPRGSSTVTCSLSSPTPQSKTGGALDCSFVVTVVDQTPPVIRCPGSITTGATSGQNTAAVDYPIATASDACGVIDVVCLPPSGSTFALGTSTVTCTARDVANNRASCSFTVTVTDREAPAISCPADLSRALEGTGTSLVVNYPAPTVSDNQPGVTVTCVPPSGSAFPLGVTTVTCAAVDTAGNRATCSFKVTVTGGSPSLDVIIPTGQPNLAFTPTPVRRKHRANGPCATFTIANNGFNRVVLSLDAILRTGSDVTSGHISDPREGDTYQLSIINADGSERALSLGDTLAIAAGGRANFCLRFSPAIPALAGNTTGLSAPQAIPDLVTSRIVFGIAGGGTISVNVNARADTALHLINPNNPRKPATFSFTKSGDKFTVSFTVYDSNLDINRARYEFLDASGTVIAGPFDVDLTQVIRDRNLVRGQSFTVTQDFTGADGNPNVSAVRVTVFDSETSETSPTITLGTAASSGFQTATRWHFATVTPPPVRLDSNRQ
ncbi:MAG: HYR domain-containing protein [Blastocatellia bacterium]